MLPLPPPPGKNDFPPGTPSLDELVALGEAENERRKHPASRAFAAVTEPSGEPAVSTDSGVAERGPSFLFKYQPSLSLSVELPRTHPNSNSARIVARIRQLLEEDCPATGRRKSCNAIRSCRRCGPIQAFRRSCVLAQIVAGAPGQCEAKLPISRSTPYPLLHTRILRWCDRMGIEATWAIERNARDPSKFHAHLLGILAEPLIPPAGVTPRRRLTYLSRRSAWAWRELSSSVVASMDPSSIRSLYDFDSVPGVKYQHRQSTEVAALFLALYILKGAVLGTEGQIADHLKLNGGRLFNYSRPILGAHTWESLGL